MLVFLSLIAELLITLIIATIIILVQANESAVCGPNDVANVINIYYFNSVNKW